MFRHVFINDYVYQTNKFLIHTHLQYLPKTTEHNSVMSLRYCSFRIRFTDFLFGLVLLFMWKLRLFRKSIYLIFFFFLDSLLGLCGIPLSYFDKMNGRRFQEKLKKIHSPVPVVLTIFYYSITYVNFKREFSVFYKLVYISTKREREGHQISSGVLSSSLGSVDSPSLRRFDDRDRLSNSVNPHNEMKTTGPSL